jgi:hypothetical protein
MNLASRFDSSVLFAVCLHKYTIGDKPLSYGLAHMGRSPGESYSCVSFTFLYRLALLSAHFYDSTGCLNILAKPSVVESHKPDTNHRRRETPCVDTE